MTSPPGSRSCWPAPNTGNIPDRPIRLTREDQQPDRNHHLGLQITATSVLEAERIRVPA